MSVHVKIEEIKGRRAHQHLGEYSADKISWPVGELLDKDIPWLLEKITEYRAKLASAQEALEFYGEPKNHWSKPDATLEKAGVTTELSDVRSDGGAIARAALTEIVEG